VVLFIRPAPREDCVELRLKAYRQNTASLFRHISAWIQRRFFFVCVLAHELGHALVARAHGLTVRDITLFIFGGVASIEEESKRPGVELQIALAGPAVSMLLAAFA